MFFNLLLIIIIIVVVICLKSNIYAYCSYTVINFLALDFAQNQKRQRRSLKHVGVNISLFLYI